MLRKFVPALLAAAIIGLPLSAGVTLPAFAQSASAEAIRVRGGIVSFSGQTLTVTGATGTTVAGGATIETAKTAILTFVCTGANSWNIYKTGG